MDCLRQLLLSSRHVPDVIAFYLRAHNAGLIIRKGPTHTTFEVFEVLIPAADIMSETGKLTRAFPGPAVIVANTTAGKRGFVSELAKFIAIMNNTPIEAAPGERRDDEDRDAPHPVRIHWLCSRNND
jgi:hypothetical protein